MGELEQLLTTTEQAIRERFEPHDFHPGKVSVWIKLVKLVRVDGTVMEEPVGNVHKLIFMVGSFHQLVVELAENMVLAVFGGDVALANDMPNLIIKLFAQKAFVPVPGGPPLDREGQVFLKATVYRYEPSLWDQLFKRTWPAR